MEKIKEGKMDKKTYWIAVAVLCFLLIVLAINMQTDGPLGEDGRIAVGILFDNAVEAVKGMDNHFLCTRGSG